MGEIQNNPFLEGSEEVSVEEAAMAAKLLAEEVQVARTRSIKTKEKVAKAKAAREKADRERAAKEQAAMEATRAQIIRTIANIPKNTGKSSLRPAAPQLKSNSEIAANRNPFAVAEATNGIQSLAADLVVTATALIFTILLLLDTIPFLS